MKHTGQILMTPPEVWRKIIIHLSGRMTAFIIGSAVILLAVLVPLLLFREAYPFFSTGSLKTFFTSPVWDPTASPPVFGARAFISATFYISLGACLTVLPFSLLSAMTLSDILGEASRRRIHGVLELFSSIPAVVYGFFGLVFLGPLLQRTGGVLPAVLFATLTFPAVFFGAALTGFYPGRSSSWKQRLATAAVLGIILVALLRLSFVLGGLRIISGFNGFTAALLLALMLFPPLTVSMTHALRSLSDGYRQNSYALGATRTETFWKIVFPASARPLAGAAIVSLARVFGETMIVWMVAGNATFTPAPWYQVFAPLQTLGGALATEIGTTDFQGASIHTGALFTLALLLLGFTFVMNLLALYVAGRHPKEDVVLFTLSD